MFFPSIVENLAHHALANPDKLCLADERKALTYKEVWDAACGLAIKLESLGVSREKCVVVECNQSVDYMVCEFAVHLLKGIFVPLEKNAALPRILEITGETEALVHVANKEIPELDIPHMEIDSLCDFAFGRELNGVYYASIEDLDVVDFPAANDVSEILFSTGTTGKSKGIVLTHGNDVAIAENVCYGVKMKPDNVEMIPMPTSHSHGLRRTYGNIANGSSVVFVDNLMLLKKVFAMMDEYRVTSMDLSPSMLGIIFKLSKDRLGDYADVLDYIQLGSAPLSEEDKNHLSRILPRTRLYNFYGSTEAGCSCLMDFNEAQKSKGCIGKPATNSEFIIVDENRNEIKSSIDNLGFLASRGAINMKEYFRAPELTAEAMPNGDYIYTKDLGYIDEDGFVYMLGRKDDVINFGGVKISPEEIESMVIKNDIIRDCACVPVDDPLTGQAPKLYIVLNDGASEILGSDRSSDAGTSNEDASEDAEAPQKAYDAKAFRLFLTEVLDANKQPKYIEVIDEIPRTFNGKIKRKVLMARN